VPGYEVLGELGRGGMGVVYRARQVGLDRLVALKVVRAGAHAGPEELARFRREAEAIARLRHPNVVEVYEVGDRDGLPYFSMELCGGGSLAQQLAGGPLAPRRAAELVETLARAVQTAHEAGIVHRDLKPANVLLTADGTPKITDFGLAKKRDDGASELTASGVILGTPAYMAPEQASGDGKHVGPAADVWALGTILYELLTGRPPFRAATPFDTLMQVLSDAPEPPARLRPGVPAALDAICLRCLEKKPARRYGSAAELADDLRRFRDGLPLAVRPQAGGAPLVRSRFRRLLNVVMLVSLSLFLLAMPLFCSFGLLNERLHPKSPLVSWAVRVTMVASFVGLISFFVSAVEYFGTGKVGALVFSPDGRFLASAGGGTVRVWDVLAERLLSTLRPGQGRVRALSFAADGTLLTILTARGTVLVCDASTGEQRQRFRLPCRALAAAAFSPDGRRIAGVKGLWAATGRTLCLWEIDEKQAGVRQRAVLDAGSLLRGSVFFSADGRTVAVSSATGLRVWDQDTAGGPPRQRLLPRLVCKASTLAPDGRTIAVFGDDKTIAVRDTRLDREICTWTTRKSTPYALALSPDGRTLAGTFAGGTRLWDLADGRLLASLPARELVQAVVFSPDGQTLAVADAGGGVTWYDVAALKRQALSREGRRPEREEGGTGERPADTPARPTGEVTGPWEVATSLPAAPAPGTEVTAAAPGYEVLGELGRGGMGVVYQARQLGLDRVVALKMILEGAAAGPEELARFRREAEAIARLEHPNIVRIYQVGEHRGMPFFSLEYCAGGSLARRIAGRPQPVRQAAELVAVLARAVQAAHEAGVIHRDLKPANVLLDADGTPKVTDFGLARKLDGASGLTQTGVVLGTPSYMAPEQASGAKDIGPAADVWSLGAILYELLTGRPPFRAATTLDTLVQVVSDCPVPPSRLRGGIPAELEAICLRCLEKDPHRRPASAAALAEDLERFLAGGVRRPGQGPPSLSRWGIVRGLFTAAVLTLPIGIVATVVLVVCDRHGVQLPVWLKLLCFLGFLCQMAGCALSMATLVHALQANREAAERRRRMPRALAFGPDGRALAVGCADGSLRLHDLVTEEVRRLVMAPVGPAPPRPAVCALAFVTRDGRHLLAAVDAAGVLTWWDPARGQEPAPSRLAGVGRMERVIAAAFSPCGRWLAAATGVWSLRPWEAPGQRWAWRLCEFLRVAPRYKVRFWDLRGGNEVVVPANTLPSVWELAFASDGSTLSAATSAGARRWGLDRARGRVEECTLPTPEPRGTVSPDGRMRATRNADGTASLWSAATGEELAVLAVEAPPAVTILPPAGPRQPPQDRAVVLVAFAPDGQALALADDQGGVAWCDVALVLRAGRSGPDRDGSGPGEGGSA
jgi:serine/threonine protein kinase/WD40 repeat protein